MEMDSWFKPVSDAVYLALCAAFGLNRESDDALARFIPAYREDVTTPQAPRNANVCYFAISLRQNTEYDYVERSYTTENGSPKAIISRPIPVSVLLTFYGPKADDDSDKFWALIQWDSGPGSARAVLRENGIVLDGKPERPVSLWETESTYNRRRCDVRMNLLCKAVSKYTTSLVQEAPEINVSSQNNN